MKHRTNLPLSTVFNTRHLLYFAITDKSMLGSGLEPASLGEVRVGSFVSLRTQGLSAKGEKKLFDRTLKKSRRQNSNKNLLLKVPSDLKF